MSLDIFETPATLHKMIGTSLMRSLLLDLVHYLDLKAVATQVQVL
jgi:hypothetical protein